MELKPYETRCYNVIKNTFDNIIEIVHYKEPFIVTTGNFGGIDEITGEVFIKGLNTDRSRKFKENNGVLTPIKDGVKINDIQRSINNSRKRTLDNIYGYVLSNSWDYFLTLTFNPEKVTRENDEDIKYAWELFRKKLQYINSNVKLFAIPERHPTSGCLHFHCLVGGVDLSSYLVRAINPKNNKLIFSNGRAVYNLTLFDFGFSTVVKTDKKNLVLANYLTKYVTKDLGNIGYNKKSYYNTRNLNFKNKELFNVNDSNLDSLLISGLAEKVKETDKLTVYRYELPF